MNNPTFAEIAEAANLALQTMELRKPNHITRENSAVLLLTGGGADKKGNGLQDWRVTECPWQGHSDCVLVTGTRGDPDYTEDRIRELLQRDGKLPLDIAYQGYHPQMNAPRQTRWGIEEINHRPDIVHVFVSTARYYNPRAALTFVSNWLRFGDGRPLSMSLLPTDGAITRELATDTSQDPLQETAKIATFTRGPSPDVANAGMLKEFLRRAVSSA